jgi:hypothetical protein
MVRLRAPGRWCTGREHAPRSLQRCVRHNHDHDDAIVINRPPSRTRPRSDPGPGMHTGVASCQYHTSDLEAGLVRLAAVAARACRCGRGPRASAAASAPGPAPPHLAGGVILQGRSGAWSGTCHCGRAVLGLPVTACSSANGPRLRLRATVRVGTRLRG